MHYNMLSKCSKESKDRQPYRFKGLFSGEDLILKFGDEQLQHEVVLAWVLNPLHLLLYFVNLLEYFGLELGQRQWVDLRSYF